MYFLIVLSLLVGLVVNSGGRISDAGAKTPPRKRAPRSKTPPRKKKSAATTSPAILNMISTMIDKVVETAVGSSEQSAKKKATKRTRMPTNPMDTDDDAIQSILNDGNKKGLLLRYKVNKISNDRVTVDWRICSNMDFKLKYAIVSSVGRSCSLQPTWKREGSVLNPLREIDRDGKSVWLKAKLTRAEVEHWCRWTKTDICTVCNDVKNYRPPKREKPNINHIYADKPRRKVVSRKIKENREQKKLIEESRKRMEEKYVKQTEFEIANFKSMQAMLSLYLREYTVDDIDRIETLLCNLRKQPACSTGFYVRTFKDANKWCFNPEEVGKKENKLRQEREKTMNLLRSLDDLKSKLLEERSRRRKQAFDAKRNEAKVRARAQTERQTYMGKPPPLKKAVTVVPETYQQKVSAEWEKRRAKQAQLKEKHGWKAKGL